MTLDERIKQTLGEMIWGQLMLADQNDKITAQVTKLETENAALKETVVKLTPEPAIKPEPTPAAQEGS